MFILIQCPSFDCTSPRSVKVPGDSVLFRENSFHCPTCVFICFMKSFQEGERDWFQQRYEYKYRNLYLYWTYVLLFRWPTKSLQHSFNSVVIYCSSLWIKKSFLFWIVTRSTPLCPCDLVEDPRTGTGRKIWN